MSCRTESFYVTNNFDSFSHKLLEFASDSSFLENWHVLSPRIFGS
ncbi:Hypothetical Protein CTN_0698 [Thermotoga neapolitana DSM 4359]|uniref:Uncharacterized protein n=1 Tax=Thermotoga neapolitana (strain ATCC 49049 / DSM 4359 / NBRC 107923 / NS-E) TaxID=309803 RepID=B9K7E1_THENN|nr:Hypothetical Protein CTN_0698 [Thermotoga neapolitana DSM 4359]